MGSHSAIRQAGATSRILAALRQSRGLHLSAGEVRARVNRTGPPVHLATVYRALRSLTARGEVKRSSLAQNHAHYELADNSGVHILCEGCGRVREERLEAAERLVSSLRRRLGGGFQVKSWQMQVVGRCRDCRR